MDGYQGHQLKMNG